MQAGTARPYPWRVFREKPVRQMEKAQKIKNILFQGFYWYTLGYSVL